MALWRNADPSFHAKGSCSGCHGADFFDLARIGSTRADIRRRAEADGASRAQSLALADAVADMRAEMGLRPEDARSFRPLQPGGAVVLPDLDAPRHLAAVQRDIAFGESLRPLLPTLHGAPIRSLEEARRARDEMLDLARGTNAAGANVGQLQLRDLQHGIAYPLWSADAHHGETEATMNDWIADVAFDPKPEFRDDWHTLQDAYLAEPSNTNFWRMYAAADTMVEARMMGACESSARNPELSCGGANRQIEEKFRSALLGQHLMRQAELPQDTGFMRDAVAFSYLTEDPGFDFMLDRSDTEFLPANMWEIGDQTRVMLENDASAGSLRAELAGLGFPDFVVNSVSATNSSKQAQQNIRLPWFWIGFTFDPSFGRIHPSNSTKVGEYMVASLLEENMHLHNSFAAHMRLVTKGTLAEANVESVNRQRELDAVTPRFDLNYSYFIGYNRTVLRWNEDARTDTLLPQDLKDTQEAMWQTFTANAFRMSLYLYEDALASGLTPPEPRPLYPLEVMFQHYQPDEFSADDALLKSVAREQEKTAY